MVSLYAVLILNACADVSNVLRNIYYFVLQSLPEGVQVNICIHGIEFSIIFHAQSLRRMCINGLALD